MKSFILPIPETPSKIQYHYFCKCGSRFISNNDNQKCKCGNSKFYNYKDVKNHNIELLETENIKQGYIAFFEYPVFRNGKIEIERKILFEYRDFLEFHDFAKSNNKDELIAEFVKLYMIKENKWKKYRYIWEKLKHNPFVLLIMIHKDPEMALWSYVDIEKIHKKSVIEFFEKFLKNRAKSIKKAVFYRYKKLINKGKYNYYFDLLVLNALDDVNLQRDLITKATDINSVFFSKDVEIIKFAKFLKTNFNKKKIFNFLKKTVKSGTIDKYLEIFNNHQIRIIDKSIENTLLKAKNEVIKYDYHFPDTYEFDGFVFKLPKTSYELIDYSFKLKNCLDNYINQHNKQCLIFGVFDQNRLKYAIEVDIKSKKLKEARGFANSSINNKDYAKIRTFVNEFKDVM